MKRVILLVLVFQVVSFAGVYADDPLTPESMLEDVVMALYHFDFQSAADLCSDLDKKYPKHHLSRFSAVYYHWWLMITWPRPAEVEPQYRERIVYAIPAARAAVERDPSDGNLFYFINLYAMLARLDLQQGAWVRSLKALRNCVEQIEGSMGREMEFGGFYLTSGLYNYLTAEAARRFPLLKPYAIFYPRGDRGQGIAHLEKAFDSNEPLWKTEAGYFLMRIHLEQAQDAPKAEPYARWLTATYPSNLIFQYYHLQVLMALKEEEGVALKKAEIRRLAMANAGISPEQRVYFLDLVRL